jgi:hypothetical protein
MRRFLLLLPFALLALPLGSATGAGGGACDQAMVGQLANAHGGVYDPHLGFGKFICHDFTGDGIKDSAFTINSGGSSGTLGWGIVRGLSGGRLKLAKFEKNSLSNAMKRSGPRDLLVSSPIYGPNDPNCCPSGFNIDTWHWTGHRFKRTHSRRVHKLHGFF